MSSFTPTATIRHPVSSDIAIVDVMWKMMFAEPKTVLLAAFFAREAGHNLGELLVAL